MSELCESKGPELDCEGVVGRLVAGAGIRGVSSLTIWTVLVRVDCRGGGREGEGAVAKRGSEGREVKAQ